MTYFQAIFLGVIQGLTEFLPVSSSGHLIFFPKIFGWADQGAAFDAMMHVATLVAVVFFFRHKIWNLLQSLLHYKSTTPENKLNRKFILFLIVSTIPAGLFGLLASDWIETKLRATWIIGFNMIFWGMVLGLSEWYRKKNGAGKSLEQIEIKHSVLMGIAQAVALFPGTSRSGITMTTGMFSGLSKKAAAEFSFLMSIPIIALAGGLHIIEIIKNGVIEVSLSLLVAGFLAAMVSGIFAIWFLMKIIEKWSFKPFVLYRILIGILIFIFLV